MALIGLDIGTTSTIGVLVDPAGRILASESRPVTLSSPAPGWSEEDPGEWWANACAILRALAAHGQPIDAVGVTGMLPAVVLLDRDGEPVRPSIQQSDARAAQEVEELRASHDERAFFRRTGCGINQQLVAPRLHWLARHEPDVLARARVLCGSYDYVNLRLTGVRSVEENWALESGFLDLATNRFAEDLVALGRIAATLLPEIHAPHEIIGAVTEEAAAASGLKPGTPVAAGCADHVASAFVAGIVEPGDVLLKFGGSADILTASARPHDDPRLYLDRHIVPGLWVPNGCMAASGAALNWIARELASGTPHAALDREAALTPPGADGLVLLPYLLGEKTPLHDPRARGVLHGLGLHHTRGHVWRAALEGIAFGFRHHLEVFAELNIPARRFVASDGGARSAVWMQIVADVLQVPIQLLDGHPGPALGAAFVAGMGVGSFGAWSEIARFTRPAARIEPNPATATTYDRLYRVYRETYERLRTLMPELSAPP
jgi:xylulokinase